MKWAQTPWQATQTWKPLRENAYEPVNNWVHHWYGVQVCILTNLLTTPDEFSKVYLSYLHLSSIPEQFSVKLQAGVNGVSNKVRLLYAWKGQCKIALCLSPPTLIRDGVCAVTWQSYTERARVGQALKWGTSSTNTQQNGQPSSLSNCNLDSDQHAQFCWSNAHPRAHVSMHALNPQKWEKVP